MRIDIESNHNIVGEDVKAQIREKVMHLEHYFENIVDAIVYLHEESDHKEVEIKLNVSGKQLFVKENAETFPGALDKCMDAMKTQLKKYKEKQVKKF